MRNLTAADALYPPTVKPSVRSLPLLPFIARFVRNPAAVAAARRLRRIRRHLRRKRPLVAWVTDPELIENILLKDAERFPKTRLDRRVLKPILGEGLLTAEGDSWRWQRKLASPLFRHSELLSYVPIMVEAADERVARWKALGSGLVTDVERDMTETTFSVIARTILAGINEAEGDAVKRAGRSYLDPITWEVAAALLMLPDKLWHPGKRRMRKAAADTRAIVQSLLDQRRKSGIGGDDLVARMLTARNPDTGQPMPDERIVDNLTTFLLAGHETTAKALTWTFYILSRAPEWQERVRDEIRAVARIRTHRTPDDFKAAADVARFEGIDAALSARARHNARID